MPKVLRGYAAARLWPAPLSRTDSRVLAVALAVDHGRRPDCVLGPIPPLGSPDLMMGAPRLGDRSRPRQFLLHVYRTFLHLNLTI